MQFIAPKKQLVEALSKVVGVADRKSPQPMLSNVLITAEDGIRFAATDLYIATSVHMDVKPKAEGCVALPAKDIFDRLKALPDGDVEILVGEAYSATIKAVGSARRFTLPGMPGADFPKLPERKDDALKFTFKAGLLRDAFRATIFAVSTDETRPHVNSLCFIPGEKPTLVATDGHRMAISGSLANDGAQYLIPLKAAQELRRHLENDGLENDVEIVICGPNSFWSVDGIDFSCKLVDAQFPPYQQVIPQSTSNVAKVPRAGLIDAVKAVSIAANDKTGGVALSIADGAMKIVSKSPDHGDGFDEIDVDYSGEVVTVGFNAKYLVEALGAFDADEVTMGFGGELDPLKITADGSDVTGVVMPQRL